MKEYRVRRLFAFLDPGLILPTQLERNQSLLAIGSGGSLG